jgi:hypothetical protein
MMQTPHARLQESRFVTSGRLSRIGRRTRSIKNMAGIPVEMFPPLALLSALAIYMIVVAAVGGSGGATP